MALTPQYSRISHHAITTAGATFHVPLGEDFTVIGGTLSWNVTGTELADREFGLNTTDNKAYLRIGSNINELLFVGGTANDQSFAETLAINNNSQTYDVIMGTATVIKSKNTGGRIALDGSSTAGEVYITTDNGSEGTAYVKLSGSGNYAEMAGIPGYSYISLSTNSDWVNMDSVTFNSNKVEVNSEIFNVSMDDDASGNGGDTIKVVNNVNNLMQSDTGDKFGTIISSNNGIIGTASYNTVILGGKDIVANTSNSVYVPDLYIQTAKSIKSTNGGGQIELDSTINGGGPGSIYLSTDSGGFTETGMFLEPGGNGAYIYSYDGGIALDTNSSAVLLVESGSNAGQLRLTTGWLEACDGSIFIKDNTIISVTSSNDPKLSAMISSQNSSFVSAINNSVILGGNNQRVSTSNTVSINHRQFLFASASNASAATTTLASISMTDGQTITITAIVNARCTSPDRNLGAKLTAVFLKYGGTIYQTSTTDAITKDGFGDGTTATIDTDGTNVRIRITNGAGLTTNWYSSYDYLLTY